MTFLDIILITAGATAGFFSFLSGKDSLHKLFLWLIIGFLMYALVSAQIDLTERLSPSEMNSYQIFLSKNATGVLSLLLMFVPIVWVFSMLSQRLSIYVRAKSPSHILLWLILPIYLVGILSYLWDGSLLSENATWQRVFRFFDNSKIYLVFQTLPWAIFVFLWIIAFYKVFFTILINFCIWFYHDIIKEFFKSWKERKERLAEEKENEDEK